MNDYKVVVPFKFKKKFNFKKNSKKYLEQDLLTMDLN